MECNAKCIWKNLDQLMAVCVQPINFQRVVSYHTLCILSMTKPSFSHFHIKEDCKMRSNYLKLFTIFVNFYGDAFIESEIAIFSSLLYLHESVQFLSWNYHTILIVVYVLLMTMIHDFSLIFVVYHN